MSTTTTIDYRNTYFPHSTIKAISGEPGYEDLHIAYKQIKKNASNVPCPSLANGTTGHLGLTTSPTAFARASAVPYLRPAAPGVFTPPEGTAAQIAAAKQAHDEATRLFNEVNLIEKILIRMLQEAIEEKYFESQLDTETGLPIGSIVEIFENLFEMYGNVTEMKLEECRTTTLAHQYQIAEPIESIFSAINLYSNMSDAAKMPATQQQLIGMGLMIFNRSHVLGSYITKWKKKDEADRTWDNFKQHFRAAHKDLRSLASSSTADTFSQPPANAAVIDALVEAEQRAEEQMNQQLQNLANAVTHQQNVNDQMTLLMQQMQTMQQQLQALAITRPPLQDRTNTTPNPANGNTKKRRTAQYCHTHGLCKHSSSQCKQPGPNHKNEATVQNMMGGSTRDCVWLTS